MHRFILTLIVIGLSFTSFKAFGQKFVDVEDYDESYYKGLAGNNTFRLQFIAGKDLIPKNNFSASKQLLSGKYKLVISKTGLEENIGVHLITKKPETSEIGSFNNGVLDFNLFNHQKVEFEFEGFSQVPKEKEIVAAIFYVYDRHKNEELPPFKFTDTAGTTYSESSMKKDELYLFYFWQADFNDKVVSNLNKLFEKWHNEIKLTIIAVNPRGIEELTQLKNKYNASFPVATASYNYITKFGYGVLLPSTQYVLVNSEQILWRQIGDHYQLFENVDSFLEDWESRK